MLSKEEQQLARELGLTLRRLRREGRLTQKGLALRVQGGVDATYIGKIERGDQLPSLKILLRLSTALGVTVSDFFYPPTDHQAGRAAPALHLAPLLQALCNRGIDGLALVHAILDVVGRHVLAAPPRLEGHAPAPGAPAASRAVIPLPMSQGNDPPA